MSVLLALNNEEYVCRKVCHPMRCVIPILVAAGRIMVRMRDCPQYGLCPRVARLAKTQSSAWPYFVWSRHTLRASARRESRGTGFCDASILHGPTTWNTMDRTTLISFFLEVDIVPLETKEFTHPQACPESQEDKSALPNIESGNGSLNFACTEYHRDCFSLCTLPYEPNRVTIADLMSDSVVEDHAHEIPDFGAT